MENPRIYTLIKTECGRNKYQYLAQRKGFISRLRLVWFVIFATIQDWNLKNPD